MHSKYTDNNASIRLWLDEDFVSLDLKYFKLNFCKFRIRNGFGNKYGAI
jgi:hypothetical protein